MGQLTTKSYFFHDQLEGDSKGTVKGTVKS